MWVGIIQSVEGLNRTKKKRKEKLAHFASCLPTELGHWSPALGWDLHHWLPWFSDLWNGITALAFLGLQLADGTSWDFPAFLITRAYSLSSISSYTYLIASVLCRILTNILHSLWSLPFPRWSSHPAFAFIIPLFFKNQFYPVYVCTSEHMFSFHIFWASQK